MKDKIITAVYNLVDEIKDKKEYKRLLELKKIINTDPLIINLVKEFNNAKKTYNEVSKYGKYHPDLKDAKNTLAKTKEALLSNVVVIEYKQFEKEIQKTLDIISKKIAQSISYKVKYPNEIGIINKH